MDTHALERTSPKGSPFIGYCTKCGKANLPLSAVHEVCPNPSGATQEQALLDAIDGPAPADAERLAASNDHWSVTVSRHGEEIVTMETNCLSGREISPDDERTIRTAAEMLLAFIGDASPEGLRTLLDEREAEVARLRAALSDALTVFDIGRDGSTEYHKAYADVIAMLDKPPGPRGSAIAAEFCREAYESTGGPTTELRRVYQTYLANRAVAAEAAAQSSREAALWEAAELVEEASKAPKDWTWGRLKTAIRALITKGGPE